MVTSIGLARGGKTEQGRGHLECSKLSQSISFNFHCKFKSFMGLIYVRAAIWITTVADMAKLLSERFWVMMCIRRPLKALNPAEVQWIYNRESEGNLK